MAKLSDFYDDVFPYVPDCPEAAVKHALLRSISEFCSNTLVWVYDTTASPTATDGEYQVSLPYSSTEVAITFTFYVVGVDSNGDETPIGPVLSDDFVSVKQGATAATRFHVKHPDIVVLTPAPDTAYSSLKLRVALTPTNKISWTASTDAVPNEIFDKYSDVVASGALMRLLAVPKKPYTNYTEANAHRIMFRRGVMLARSNTMRMNSPAVLFANMPFIQTSSADWAG